MEFLKNNYKKIMIGICIFILFILYLIFQRYIPIPRSGNEKDNYDVAIEVISQKIPTEVWVYGEDVTFRESVPYKTINDLSNKSLTTDKDYSALIINDWNGTVKMTAQDIAVIKKKADEDNNFYFFYLGKDKLEQFVKEGLFQKNSFDDKDLCVAIVTYCGERLEWSGIFAESDYEVAKKHNIQGRPEEFIIEHIAMCYESNN